MYPGIIGSTHGVKKLINPAPKANASLMIMVTLYLPFNFTANTILAHDIQIPRFFIHSIVVIHLYKVSKYF